MNPAGDFHQALRRARELHDRGHLAEAEQAYRALRVPAEYRESVLDALADLYLQADRVADAARAFAALIGLAPDNLGYHTRLAGLLEQSGRIDDAVTLYKDLIARNPRLAGAHFNLALLYKQTKRIDEAIAEYEMALQCGIGNAEEVYSNLGVLYAERHQPARAEDMYDAALALNKDYIPALFNLAGLKEECGEREQATGIYNQILLLDPRHWESLSRLAYMRTLTSRDIPLIDTIRRALEGDGGDPLAREGLYFALGKAQDDLGNYDEAYQAYLAANQLGAQRNPRYEPLSTEREFDRLITEFSHDWVADHSTGSTERPVFICGMFRSGSTLVEQVLSAHAAVTAGGELDYVQWLLMRELAPFPDRVLDATVRELYGISQEYMTRLSSHFPEAGVITDKRPDNFLYLGLIKALFPRARIVYTRRDMFDNCLSIFFQQLGGNLNYATALADIAHYYRQHDRLMAHWNACFGEDIFDVDYDALVHSPESVLRPLLGFLGLEWDERCLEFQQSASLVKTASVWQVREGLYTRSSGRWRNYAAHIAEIRSQLA